MAGSANRPIAREGGADGGLRDGQAEPGRGESLSAHQALVTDARPTGEFRPLAVFPLIQGERIDPLAGGDIFAQAHDVESDRGGEFEDQLGRGDGIINGPITVRLSADQVFGGESLIVATHVAGREFGLACVVNLESGG